MGRTRCQLSLTGDITQGINTRSSGVLVLIDSDIARIPDLHAGNVQIEILDLRRTTNSPQQLIHLQHGIIHTHQPQQLILALAVTDQLHLLEPLVVAVHVDPRRNIPIRHGLLDHGVEFAQEVLAADEHVRVHAHRAQHTRQFHGDVARAHDGELGREVFNLEEAVAGDTVLGTLDLGDIRTTPGSNEDVIRGVLRLPAINGIHLNSLGLDEARTAVHEVNTLAVPVPLISTIQPLDHGIPRVLEVVVVDVDILGDIVPVVLTDLEGFVDGRKVPGHFFRHAAHVHAGSARPATFHNQRLCTVPASCPTSAATASTSAANDNVIILLLVGGTHCCCVVVSAARCRG